MWISDQMKTLPFLYSKNLYWDIQCAKDNLIPFLFDCFASLSLKKKHLPVAKVHFPLNHAWIKFTAETIYSMKKKNRNCFAYRTDLFVPFRVCSVLKIVEQIIDFCLNIKFFLF